MTNIPEIDRLLRCDEENIQQMQEFLHDESADIPAAFDACAKLYGCASQAYGEGIDGHFRDLSVAIDGLGASDISEFESKLSQPSPKGQAKRWAEGLDALGRFYSRENRGILLARMGVLFGTAAADLLRMRITSPLGLVRVQVESIALMKLMADRPEVARKWRSILTDRQGLRFYQKYQGEVLEILDRFELRVAYERASGTALHSRFAGVALGIRSEHWVEDGKIHQNITVRAQEFDPDNPDFFVIFVLYLLRVQQRILSCLPQACPEIGDTALLRQGFPEFEALVDQLWDEFATKRPELARRHLGP